MESHLLDSSAAPPVNPFVTVHSRGSLRVIELTRPANLNSLNDTMISTIHSNLKMWATSEAVTKVVITGKGRAFCAGGDVVAIASSREPAAFDRNLSFFSNEYELNHYISIYPKPIISIWDGIVMGGGLGISVHGNIRVATERTLLAMPETSIGLLPDVGGTYFLSRLNGNVGMWLGMSGARLKSIDSYYARLATHFVHSSAVGALVERLSDDAIDAQNVGHVMAEFAGTPEPSNLLGLLPHIRECFGQATVADIFEQLERVRGSTDAVASQWASDTLGQLSACSPTSLAVTRALIKRAEKMSLSECLTAELGAVGRCLKRSDFYEGVRAKLIEKSGQPQWVAVEEVNDYLVPHHSAIGREQAKSKLPAFGLPSATEIEGYCVKHRVGGFGQLYDLLESEFGGYTGFRLYLESLYEDLVQGGAVRKHSL